MPGISGWVADGGAAPSAETINRMSAALQTRDIFTHQTWAGPQAGLQVVDWDAERQLAQMDGSALALTGQLLVDETLEERLRCLPEPVHLPAAGDFQLARSLLKLYLQSGTQALQGLNGMYALAIWDDALARLTLLTDRAGLHPLYYWHGSGGFYFATRVAALASLPAFPRQVDPAAVMDLLAAEQMLDERTLFAAARALPPGAMLTFDRRGPTLTRYWQPRLHQSGGPELPEADALDGLYYYVQQAAERAVKNIVYTNPRNNGHHPSACLLLTGGLDSRLLAALLTCSGENNLLCAGTIGHERAYDVLFARKIAQATGLFHNTIASDPAYLVKFAETGVRRTDGGFNVHASWVLGMEQFLLDHHITGVLTGVGAENISGRHWLSEQRVPTREAAFERLVCERWNYPRSVQLLRSDLRAAALEESQASLWRTLAEAPGDAPLGWGDYFSFRQSRRHPTGNILSEAARVFEPYFDTDLVDFAYQLPPVLRGGGALYRKMIIERLPQVAGIGYSDTGQRLNGQNCNDSSPWSAQLQAFNRRLIRQLERRLPLLRGEPFGDKISQTIYYNHWLRTAARTFILNLLDRTELYADVFDVAQVQRLVNAHMSGQADAYRLVDAVLTFVLWRKAYV